MRFLAHSVQALLASPDPSLHSQAQELLLSAADAALYADTLAGWRRERRGAIRWQRPEPEPFLPEVALALWLEAPPEVRFPRPLQRGWVPWLTLSWPAHAPLLPRLGDLPGLRFLRVMAAPGAPPLAFSALPPGIRYLDLWFFKRPDLLAGIEAMPDLRALGLGRCALAEAPAAAARLPRLERLSVGHVRGRLDLSPLAEAPALADLELAGAPGYGPIPSGIGRLAGLRALHLLRWGLAELPPDLLGLGRLETLDLRGNRLAELPPGLGALPLRRLRAHGNALTALPPEIGDLSSLAALDVSSNRLAALPPEIGRLAHLRELLAGGNALAELPPAVGALSELRRLRLGANRLRRLPPEIGALSRLRELYLGANQLTELPPSLAGLADLRQLRLARNPLAALPPGLEALPRLRVLDLAQTPLAE